ncbi:hypothetical protein HPC49_05895 [Pyxidicoccus fallax]|uniref:Ig-like domain-containing protein n=1 Tax=Pyxidicoccus fallax TaxID=394095 RepID=A0A848LA81_9BACT|nr:Ig-like domain-containing protein [Pyxidicoccus fallax]NMO15162.1 hypothetical protein [Pyxidicoccus fallax]NPC77784.1 hypothetical protein [Pyxidicoccus fallax]
MTRLSRPLFALFGVLLLLGACQQESSSPLEPSATGEWRETGALMAGKASVPEALLSDGGSLPTLPPRCQTVGNLSGEPGDARFYSFDLPAGPSGVTFRLGGGTGDADLYVRRDEPPTDVDYDCAPFGTGNDEACAVSTSASGTWHVMVLGFDSYAGATLSVCREEPTCVLQNGVAHILSGDAGSDFRCMFEVPQPVNRLTVRAVRTHSGSGLYVRREAPPTTTQYDCLHNPTTLDSLCQLSNAGSGLWHVALLRADGSVPTGSVTLTGSYNTTDTTAPDTVLSPVSAGQTGSSATFFFQSNEANVRYECRLDGAPAFTVCSQNSTYFELTAGSHRLEVRARDASGNVDGTPATYTWNVVLAEPETDIVSGPLPLSNSASATFTFQSNMQGAWFECRVDNAPTFATCPNPFTVTTPSDGAHRLLVRARTTSGVDPTPAVYDWVVDRLVPVAPVITAPAQDAFLRTRRPIFQGMAEPGTLVRFSLDAIPMSQTVIASSQGAWSFVAPMDLPEGSHVLQVTSVDQAGNMSASTQVTFHIDVTSPLAPVVNTPAEAAILNTQRPTLAGAAEPGTVIEVYLDLVLAGATPVASNGTWSFTATQPLVDGAHVVTVRAMDRAGNPSLSSPPRHFLVDTVAPQVVIVTGPMQRTRSRVAEFTFTTDGPDATFECRVDLAVYTACGSPYVLLDLLDGTHVLEVRAVDAAGNRSPNPARWQWTVDLMPPDTAFAYKPPELSTARTDSFDFSSPESPVTFEYRLDGSDWALASDPLVLSGLPDGPHTLEARARDSVGNVDPTPATYTWTINNGPPDTSIVNKPPGLTRLSSATFSFGSTEAGVAYECSLDMSGVFTPCTNPVTFDNLAQGWRTLHVRARDPMNNHDASPARYSWNIDLTAPETGIASGPPLTGAPATATFDFFANETNVFYDCALDGGAFARCADPVTFANLAPGEHVLQVRARDLAGNQDATPAAYAWRVGP